MIVVFRDALAAAKPIVWHAADGAVVDSEWEADGETWHAAVYFTICGKVYRRAHWRAVDGRWVDYEGEEKAVPIGLAQAVKIGRPCRCCWRDER